MIIKQDIDFKKIATTTGIKKGKIFYSSTWNSWVISGHPNIDLICIDPPYKKGDQMFGKTVKKIKIENNQWVFNCA